MEICIMAGSLGFFLTLFLLFCRFLPTIAMFEVKPHVVKGHGADEEYVF